ncbi:MAG TPA: dynamin family protein [Candidatus Acidoferrales bacterium]|nr:dynamin family protein [Candidatus Acidoferrales bacterium]
MLRNRLAEGRFYVACVGQFKRGKSTLLNALIGRSLLPTGIIPITTAVTVLRYGERLKARVRIHAEWRDVLVDELTLYVSEEHNPSNEKGVSLVEVFVPHPLLASGMSLVDTPGIGSVVVANTEATKAFVPHIDAALVVIGADPPISGEEVALIEQAFTHVRALIVVLNKADRQAPDERREAIAFALKVLAQRLGREVGPVLEVSATERLAGGEASYDWQTLEQTLMALATTAGATLVREAEQRGIQLLRERLLHVVEVERDALLAPLAESEQRMAALRLCANDAQRALADLSPLFGVEQQRLGAAFKERWEIFLSKALPAAAAEFSAAMKKIAGPGAFVRQQAIEVAQQIAARWTSDWLRDAEPTAEQLYRAAAARFVELANGFLDRLIASTELLGGLPRGVSAVVGLRAPSRFYSTELMYLTGRTPLHWFLDRMMPAAFARRRTEAEIGKYLTRLVITNTSRVVNDLDERVSESRHSLEAELCGYLDAVAIAAQRALEHARDRKAAGAAAVQVEVARLNSIHERTAALTSPSRSFDLP